MAYRPDFDRLLTAGSRYAEDDVEYVLERHGLGELVLPTGRIVGCDPLCCDADTEAFTVAVTPGRYPVWAWVAVLFKDSGEEWQRRVAALQVEVGDGDPVRWELALVGDQDPATLGDNQFFGYGVDAGTGTLIDESAARLLASWEWDQLDEVFVEGPLPEAPVPGAINAVVDEASGANVVCTTSGWGDGAYPTFIGYDSSGAVTSFVTDFCVVPRND
jgi:hypothetical protein